MPLCQTTRAAAIAARCGCLSWPRGSWRCGRRAGALHAHAGRPGETVHLSVLDGFDVVYVDKIDSPQPIRYSMIGGRAGYAVTRRAALSVRRLRRALCGPVRSTPATSSPCRCCSGRAAQGGARRYAINRGEWREGVTGWRGAVQQPGPARGGRGHLGPLDRLSAARMKQLAPDVAACAGDIPGHGYRGFTVAPASASAATMRRAGPRQAGVHVRTWSRVGAAGQAQQVIAGCTTPPASNCRWRSPAPARHACACRKSRERRHQGIGGAGRVDWWR